MKSKVLFVFLSLFLLFGVVCHAQQVPQSKSPYIEDTIDALAGQDLSLVQKALSAAEARSGCLVRAYVYEYGGSGSSSRVWGDDYRAQYGYSSNEDLVLLVICLESGTYYYDLYLYGYADERLSLDDSDDILDAPAVKSNIKGGRLYEGLLGFASAVEDAFPTAQQLAAQRRMQWIILTVVSAVVGLLGGAVAVGVTVYRYKKKLKSPIYPLEKYASLELSHASDRFLRSDVTRVRIQSTSSGSSRSGGSRGGGGGHRGGR